MHTQILSSFRAQSTTIIFLNWYSVKNALAQSVLPLLSSIFAITLTFLILLKILCAYLPVKESVCYIISIPGQHIHMK